jgi:hypothetical protein
MHVLPRRRAHRAGPNLLSTRLLLRLRPCGVRPSCPVSALLSETSTTAEDCSRSGIPACWAGRPRPSRLDVHHRSSVRCLLRYPGCVGALFRRLQIGSSGPSPFSMSFCCASPSLAYHITRHQSVTLVNCAVRSSGLGFLFTARSLVLFVLPSGDTKKARHSSWSFQLATARQCSFLA